MIPRSSVDVTSSSSSSGAAQALNASLYPDLIKSGGLGALLREMAAAGHIDLGDIQPDPPHGDDIYAVRMTSDRGPIFIQLVLDSRRFAIHLGDAKTARGCASGSTPDIDEATQAIEAWRHGAKLKEMAEKFPFIGYTRLDQGYEDGNPVETQWNILLEDDDFRDYHDLLAALHAEPEVSRLFPYFSHWVLRLTKDRFDLDVDQIAISDVPESSRYEVYLLKAGDEKTAVPADEVVNRVKSLLNNL
jgi:hypothetical protein